MNFDNLVFLNGAWVSRNTAGYTPATTTPLTPVSTTYLVAERNLSDLTNTATARTNLGLDNLYTRRHTTLTPSDNNTTLSTTYDDYFCVLENGESVNVTLPDADTMEGRELTFVNTTEVFEAWFTIYGPIENGSQISVSGFSSYKIICDGTNWWITSSYTP